jgi:alginate O-acetyltransferase complex protein AlgI
MLFNSIQFAIFLPVVFALYWFVFNKSSKSQNILLLLASLAFYAWADYRFLILLFASILINFYVGLKIFRSEKEKQKKLYLWLGLIFNIGILFFFKYFNFFAESFINLFNVFNAGIKFNALRIILPLGISFFTFQMLGYIIDIHREEIEPSNNLLDFSVYVAFFPKLLAGPIERAQKFLPQIAAKRIFNSLQATDGLRQILWGLFVKLVVSNNCAIYADNIYNGYASANGSTLLLGAIFYMFQIYGDFSGYSNIAIGVSKLFGINLMTNFARPFFSTNISDFWKKWHISLTSWMMDYVNNPLSFKLRRYKKVGMSLSIVCTFLLVGFWHGAEWKYLLYGLLHGIYFIPLLLMKNSKRSSLVAKGKLLPGFKETVQMTGLFFLVCLTGIFFRADSITDAIKFITGIFNLSLFSVPVFQYRAIAILTLCFVLFMLVIEWITREKDHPLTGFETKYPVIVRWGVYYALSVVIFIFSGGAQPFIYFQF